MEKSSGIGNTDVGLVVWADLVLFCLFCNIVARGESRESIRNGPGKGFHGFCFFLSKDPSIAVPARLEREMASSLFVLSKRAENKSVIHTKLHSPHI